MKDDKAQDPTTEPAQGYTPAAVTDLGSVTDVTLGSNRSNNADDTEYFQ
ncbi:hypothetical protein MUU72_29720 [Streptomyces sp. RS10V-4]|nr:hypothetical protein [Streptomyces rhizoryzae]MCK7627225.1 hypothetical protein [Streptomyces rhizoryzae]